MRIIFIILTLQFLISCNQSNTNQLKFFSKKTTLKSIDIDSLLKTGNNTNIVMAIDEYLNKYSDYGENIEKLTEPQKNVLFIENLEREINNGGFNQFYFNTSGDFSLETVDALLAIGASKTALIVKKANSQFPDPNILKDRGQRQEVLLQIEDKAQPVWDECDTEFYKYQEHISDLLVKYIEENKEKFK